MTDSDWDRQWALFHAALERPAEERAEYVRFQCADSTDLADRVLQLLAAHETRDSILERPLIIATDVADDLDAEAMIGQDIGTYRLLSVIGEGGMGVVYEAQQSAPVRRRVALKIIKLGMNSREVVRRFEMERQSLAVMTHPNIAQVFDAGTTDNGRPYFVMEIVDGVPVTAFSNDMRLNTRERLGLCRQVFAGIQHAHQKGIVHRDIKPSNVMVVQAPGQEPVVKIIDFGIAKATDPHAAGKTVFTEFGKLIGTPAYMSPEQAMLDSGGVDTRSDVYSLSVLLYELLTGALPFDNRTLLGAGYAEMQRVIREEDPPSPSTRISQLDAVTALEVANSHRSNSRALSRELTGDLDWIILKGMQKEPSRRYATVSEFAADIERYLKNEPVDARPPGIAYRLQKFVRRHSWGAAVSAVAVIALVVFVTSTILQSRQLAIALESAETEQTKAEQVSAFLVELLKRSDPNVAQGESISVRTALDKGAETLESGLDDQPDIKATILIEMAEIYRELGLYEQSRKLIESAKSTIDRMEDAGTRLQGNYHQISANLSHDEGDYETASSHYADALRLRRTGNEHLMDLAMTLENYGALKIDEGEYQEASELLLDAIAVARRGYAGDHGTTAQALRSLGYNYYQLGEYDVARPLYEEADGMTRRLYGDESNQLATALSYSAALLQRLGEYQAAISSLLEAEQIYKITLGGEHAYVATTLNNLSRAYNAAGEPKEAEAYAEKSLEIYERIFSGPHPNKAAALHNLGTSQLNQGRYDDAERTFRRVLAEDRALVDEDHPSVTGDLQQLAKVLAQQGKLNSAAKMLEDVLARRLSAVGPEHPSSAITRVHYADVLIQLARYDEAQSQLTEALQAMAGRSDTSAQRLAALTAQANLRFAIGELAAADDIYSDLLEKLRDSENPQPLDLAGVLHGLGQVRVARGMPAAVLLREALDLRTTTLGPEHPDSIATEAALKSALPD